jgi:hypothetical protein
MMPWCHGTPGGLAVAAAADANTSAWRERSAALWAQCVCERPAAETLLLKTTYKFKKSYGGARELQTALGARYVLRTEAADPRLLKLGLESY